MFLIEFLKVDGPVYNFGKWVLNLFVLNTLWVLFSLPLVTMGAATAGLFYVTNKLAYQEEVGLIAGFWRGFRDNFKQATALWLLFLVVAGALIFVLQNSFFFAGLSRLVMILQGLVLVEWVATYLYLLCLIPRYRVSSGDALRSSFLMANRHLFRTIFLLAVLVGLSYLVYYVGFLLFFAVSGFALVVSHILTPIFELYQEQES